MSPVAFLTEHFIIFLFLSGIVLSLLYEERIYDMKPSHYINWRVEVGVLLIRRTAKYC